VAWLAQRTDKTTVTRLLRCSWEAVAAIVARVVVEHVSDTRLEELYRIGVDEVSFRKGHRYLAVVADHDLTAPWCGSVKASPAPPSPSSSTPSVPNAATVCRRHRWTSGAYANVTRARAPQARVCANPFHVVKLANTALDGTRRAEWNKARRAGGVSHPVWGRTCTVSAAQVLKHTRWALLKDPATLTDHQRGRLDELRRTRHVLFRAWALKELRDLYRLPATRRPDAHLDAWLARACRCRIPAFVALTKTIRAHRDEILAAVDLELSNSKLEGLNSKIRLINHRGYGHHRPPPSPP
jgi:transposase